MSTSDARSDAALVAAAVGGDRAAFGAIYERYVDRVHGFCYSFLRSSADAADATQDTFVRAAEQLAHLRDPARLRPWLFAVARTTALARLRRRGRDAPSPAVSEMADVAPAGAAGLADGGPAASAEQRELARLVWDAAAGLDDRDRLVLELTVREGLDGGELADALGVSHAHAHVLAHRARQRVERALGAVLVARLGRDDCAELARLLAGWDGRFSVGVRKRVVRHVDGCDTCAHTRSRTLSPVALLGLVPIVPMAAERRDAVLVAATSALDAGPAPRPPGYRDDGFPPADALTRRRRPPVGWAAAAAAVVVALAVAVTAGSRPTRLTADGLDGQAAASRPSTDAVPGGGASGGPAAPGSGGPAAAAAGVAGEAPVAAPAGTATPSASPAARPAATAGSTAAPSPSSTETASSTTPEPVALPTLDVSARTVDLGTSLSSRRVRLTNLGPGRASWSAASPAATVTVTPSSGTLAAEGFADLVVALDRGGHAEGAVDVTVRVDGGRDPLDVRVRAVVGRAPVIRSLTATPTTVRRAGTSAACTQQTSRVVAVIDDESGVARAEVVLPSGRVPMTLGRDGYSATVGPFATAGTVALRVEATDTRGNTVLSDAVTLTVQPC